MSGAQLKVQLKIVKPAGLSSACSCALTACVLQQVQCTRHTHKPVTDIKRAQTGKHRIHLSGLHILLGSIAVFYLQARSSLRQTVKHGGATLVRLESKPRLASGLPLHCLRSDTCCFRSISDNPGWPYASGRVSRRLWFPFSSLRGWSTRLYRISEMRCRCRGSCSLWRLFCSNFFFVKSSLHSCIHSIFSYFVHSFTQSFSHASISHSFSLSVLCNTHYLAVTLY